MICRSDLLASDTMIHAETDSCIVVLDLDATSAVESKLRKFCRPCRAIMSIMELAMAKILILPEAARGPFRVNRCRLVAHRRSPHVRCSPFATEMLHCRDLSNRANLGLTHAQQQRCGGCTPYSITSSARASSFGGTFRPSALAVLRLMTSSYLVGACTGRSAGFVPLRMRST